MMEQVWCGVVSLISCDEVMGRRRKTVRMKVGEEVCIYVSKGGHNQ